MAQNFKSSLCGEKRKTKQRQVTFQYFSKPLSDGQTRPPPPPHLTYDDEGGGALGPAQGVLCEDGVLAHVLGRHAQDQHGAHAADVGDVVVGVGVKADVVAVPSDAGLGVPLDGAAHVALVALGRRVALQRHHERRRAPRVRVFPGRRVDHKPFCDRGGRGGGVNSFFSWDNNAVLKLYC